MTKNIANKVGEYKNFTGVVDYEGSNGHVKNATFELEEGKIFWYKGIWESGFWGKGRRQSGYYRDKDWHDGTRANGKDDKCNPHKKGDSPIRGK